MKICLAGAGAFGVKHIEALAKIDGVEVSSLVGRTREATEEVAKRYGIGHVATDLSESLALYLVPGLGAKQFLVASEESSAAAYTDSARTFCSMSSDCGVVNTLLFPGATGGLAAQMTENLSFYVAGNVTSGVVIGG